MASPAAAAAAAPPTQEEEDENPPPTITTTATTPSSSTNDDHHHLHEWVEIFRWLFTTRRGLQKLRVSLSGRALRFFLWYVLYGTVGKLVITLWLCFYGAVAPMHEHCPTELWQITHVSLPLMRAVDAETHSYQTVYGTMWTFWDSGHLWSSCTGFLGVWALWTVGRLLLKIVVWLLCFFGVNLSNMLGELKKDFHKDREKKLA